MAIFSPLAGRFSDRVEPRLVATVGMVFVAIAMGMFSFIADGTTLLYVAGSLGVFGIGLGLFSSPNTNAVMGSVDKKSFGVASGVLATMRYSGMSLSMATVMILFSILIGQADITPEYYPAFLLSMKIGFSIFSALCFIGIFVQFGARNKTRELKAKP